MEPVIHQNPFVRGHKRETMKPVGPVRPRPHLNNLNNTKGRGGSFDEGGHGGGGGFIPSNPNTLTLNNNNNNGTGDGRTLGQRSEDSWKASLRKRDPEIHPSLPSLQARSRSNSHSNPGSGNSGSSDGGVGGGGMNKKSKSTDRIPRLPERDTMTGGSTNGTTTATTPRARATWRIPNRRASELIRAHRGSVGGVPTKMNNYRNKSDGDVDVSHQSIRILRRVLSSFANAIVRLCSFQVKRTISLYKVGVRSGCFKGSAGKVTWLTCWSGIFSSDT